MRETELIRAIDTLARTTMHSPQVLTGIGDDCAVVRPRPGEDLVFTTDLTIEDRHFTRATHTAADVGYKGLARSLSDLAAVGAEPLFCLVSLAIPAGSAQWVKAFYRGLTSLAKQFDMALAGGDLARADKVTVDVMCCGRVHRNKALLRSGARPGDSLYVTGELGGSALGFEQKRGKTWARHKRPVPRVAAGRELVGLASACIDISDGLSLDLHRLCEMSGVGAAVTSIPVWPGASIEQALHGGEDYELLFTAPHRRIVPSRIASVPVTRIGEVTAHTGTITYGGNSLEPSGFDHFR
jgi:thiamine-monophosphate kinase